MKHFGDITKLSGYELPIVDVITGGSPCQDLSVAGRRAGLDGERSGLFMEQIRIVKEMRERDRANGRTGFLVRPRYMVWENVPGAFSSNKGGDFKTVLEEIIKIEEPEAPDLPDAYKDGWTKSGCIYDEMGRWSIAWRVHDAQFWGVPQRRKRIALVADFGGLSAPEVLLERKGLSWNSESGKAEREGIAGRIEIGTDASSRTITFQERPGKPGGGKGILIQNDRTGALSTLNNQSVLCTNEAIPINTMVGTRDSEEKRTTFGIGQPGEPQFTLSSAHEHAVFCLNDQGGRVLEITQDKTATIRAQEHGHQPIIFEPRSQDGVPRISDKDISPTLNTMRGGRDNRVLCNEEPLIIEMTSTKNTVVKDGISPTLTARMGTGGNQVNAILDKSE